MTVCIFLAFDAMSVNVVVFYIQLNARSVNKIKISVTNFLFAA